MPTVHSKHVSTLGADNKTVNDTQRLHKCSYFSVGNIVKVSRDICLTWLAITRPVHHRLTHELGTESLQHTSQLLL